jgi:hypothetical protein
MFRTGRNFAPSLAVQCPVHDRMMDRAAEGGFIGGLHRGYDQHATRLRLFEKRKQQLLFLLEGQVLAMTAPRGFAS